MMLFELILLVICSCCTSQELLSQWISYPIHDVNDESVQQIILNSINSLSINGAFHIKNFLSNSGLSLLQQQMSSIEHKRNRKIRTKNVFQDSGDLNNFDSQQHPRNHLENYSIGFIGKSGLTSEFISLYQYKPLLNFFKQILTNTYHSNNDTLDVETYCDLYLSSAKEGSVYAYIAQNEDSGAWHFDQHPFSCVWMISKPYKGGDLKFQYTPPMQNENYTTYYDKKLGYNWDFLAKIIVDNNANYFNQLSANEGDVYCFKGNITVHMVDQVFGDKLRSVIITAFADYPNFDHIPEIDKVNAWGDHKSEL